MSATRELVIGLRRTPLLSALSIVTIAFALFAFGLFGLVALNIDRALGEVEERVEVRAFLHDGTAAEARVAAMQAVSAFPEVQSVEYVSPEQALARARQELREFSDVFESDFLPAAFEVRLKPGFRDPDHVRVVATRIAALPVVEDVRYGQEWVEKFHELRNVATAAGVGLGLTFAAVAVIIIGATIRMSVLARAQEIAIMRLVGATDGYIRRPFLLDGLLKGVVGGGLALLLTWAASVAITRYLVPAHFFEPPLAAAGVAGGALIGLLGSLLAVGRHLRQV
ncbi:MAG TPA: permease-like cell division protein FtsX [Gemmatimonadaceae bacterium]|nr:permease-like cell division protein FtsX [Gemmatimonadaceae bacterium]